MDTDPDAIKKMACLEHMQKQAGASSIQVEATTAAGDSTACSIHVSITDVRGRSDQHHMEVDIKSQDLQVAINEAPIGQQTQALRRNTVAFCHHLGWHAGNIAEAAPSLEAE